MKRALSVIVPLLLAIALLVCTAWYFLVYDQELTQEILLSGARKFNTTGNHKISAFLYDLAYLQSRQDDEIAVELANQYLEDGNFTKAEYTISEAISRSPTADLYASLCSIYVQQDKLLDAVNLLTNIPDPVLRDAIDSRRPALPTVTPEAGYYSEYITVEVSTQAAQLYVSTDGEYPSLADDLYSQPFTLSSGETVIYALAVGEDGLVSPLAVMGYTIGGVIEEVTFADPAVEAAVRVCLGFGEKETIFTDDLWAVTEFVVPAEAKTYEDLIHLTNLEVLTIPKESSGSLSVLSSLQALKELHITGITVAAQEMELIGAHTGLTALTLSNCSLSTVSSLEMLHDLEYLDLSGNTLRNIGILAGMPNLKQLNLANNVVTDLSALVGLTKLESLDISYNSVTSLEPLRAMYSSLVTLKAPHNQLSNAQALADLKLLQELDLSHNSIPDISPLSGLTELTHLNVSNNALTAVNAAESMLKLRIFNFSYNQVTDLPAFSADCQLVSIDASHNLLLNVDALAGLPWLNTVNIDYNAEVETLEPLDSCYLLIRVNAYGTKVTEVTFLTEKSIVVNYDPTLENEE